MDFPYTLGFIGVGNMGSALARAASRQVPSEQILLSNRTPEKARSLAQELGCQAVENQAAAQQAHFLFLGVKPQMMAGLLADLAPILRSRQDRYILVSMAAGLTIDRLTQLAGTDCPIIRIMPNTPAAIGQGMILYTCGAGVRPEEESALIRALAGAGRLAKIPEEQMDAASAVAGCGPAFADLFMEALADGGVACGLPRALAMELAAQMLAGSAQLALESGLHPGVLKDAVCSPAGSTIEGVRRLERGGFRSAVMEAVIAACERNRELG